MKPVLTFSILLLCVFSLTTCPFPKSLLKNKNHMKTFRTLKKIRHLPENTDTDFETTEDIPYNATSSSSGLSTGGIIAIAIPCIAALVGVGVAAAILGGSAAPALATTTIPPALTPVAAIPPPTYIDTSMAKLAVPQEVPVQPQIIQPQIEVPPPQPVQQVVPINKVEPPIIKQVIPKQPIVQPQMVPVQQMQLVPVQQVEMVPVQHVEMVPVQEVVPTYQAAQVVPQVAQVGQIGQIGQVGQIGGIQGAQGIQGGEFLTAPEGYGTSVIQSGTNPLNIGEFSSNNLM